MTERPSACLTADIFNGLTSQSMCAHTHSCVKNEAVNEVLESADFLLYCIALSLVFSEHIVNPCGFTVEGGRGKDRK